VISTQVALLKREIWEHRAIYVTPLVIALIVSMMSITGQVAVSAFDQAVDIAILGATNLGEAERASAITVLMISISLLFILAMWVLTIFYSLDSLYAERKDKSILFWRSVPITDAETVVSKLVTAMVVIPLVTFVVLAATHIVVLSISSIWVSFRGANAGHLIWQAAPLLDNWIATLIFLLAIPLWLAPFIGWFLLVSAYTKRSPLLVAFLPIIVLPMLERSLVGTRLFADAIFVRSGKMPLFQGIDTLGLWSDDSEALHELGRAGISFLSLVDLNGFLASPGLWLGLVVCGLFATAAIYVRRYRDES
jgi:ABC-2 type transport system permease protein